MGDLLAGRVAMMFDGPPTQLGVILSGKVRGLAITTTERSPVLPDVPPVADLLPGYAIPFWMRSSRRPTRRRRSLSGRGRDANKARRRSSRGRSPLRRDRCLCGIGSKSPAGPPPLLAPAARLSGQDREGRGYQAGGGESAIGPFSGGRRFPVAQFPPRTLRSAWPRMYVNIRALFACNIQRAIGSQ